MLVQSRRNGETAIEEGGELERVVKITVLQFASRRMKFGIVVDGDTPAYREEAWQVAAAYRHLATASAAAAASPAGDARRGAKEFIAWGPRRTRT
ncbi:MAG: hypothetical protein SFU86_24790 [Pirellulaceae bacterium]|nr:hypothetical protein [Pirellulaceae bacterium]